MKRVALSLAVLGLLLASCSGPTVTLELRFPSQTAFIATSLVDFNIVPLGANELGRCPELVGDVLSDSAIPGATGLYGVPRCDVLRNFAMPDPGAGARAFIVEGLAETSGATLLIGCAVGEAYPGGPPIRVDLYPTDGYAAVASTIPPGSTVAGACP